MHLITALTIPFLLLTTCTPLTLANYTTTRNATAVLNDLIKLTTDLTTLAHSITAYTGGLTAALDIQHKETIVEHDLDRTTRDTHAATPFTADESTTTTRAALGLEPDILTSIETLVRKVRFHPGDTYIQEANEQKPLVDQIGIGFIVKMDLVNLKSKTDILSQALQEKATEGDRETLAEKTKELDMGFDIAILAYS
ncbi:hydrophobic surface binding protein A-domain-containing protein [Aspergillus coremiiformis]|uniref:Hydrophobic surface binding protein A-domain-containing protein n=1 Tax=Aspergillus coremiiformis TaxID=138285 RepID=A0A5N6ZH71_9EURO|nr:hydrophobic surface binding protein A-domain-containing protein [Aspergillus coremiiformis]